MSSIQLLKVAFMQWSLAQYIFVDVSGPVMALYVYSVTLVTSQHDNVQHVTVHAESSVALSLLLLQT